MDIQKTHISTEANRGMSSAIWIAILSFGVIIIIALVLFILPSPKSDTTADVASTTTESVTDKATDQATKPAPSTSTGSTGNYPAPGSRVLQNGVYVTTILFNGKTFNPASVTITHGEEVKFINTSNLTMDIGPQMPNASSPAYTALNQPMAKGKGGIYQIGLTDIGIWAYANQTGSPAAKGTVIVK